VLFDDRFGYFIAVEDDLVPVIGDFLADGVLFRAAGGVSDRCGCFDVVRPIDLSNSFLIAELLTVGLHPRREVRVSLRLDDGKSVAETLVINDCGVAHPLIFAEGAIGKKEALGADFQAVIWEVVNVNILAHKPFGKRISLQNDPLAVIRQSQLDSDIALFAVAQDIGQFSTEIDRGRCRSSGRAEGIAKRSLNWTMKVGKNRFPALMSQTLASLSSFTSLSWNVLNALSILPLACGE